MPIRTEVEKMRDHLYKALAIAEKLCEAQDPKEVQRKSDSSLIGQLHRYAFYLYKTNGQQLIHRSKLMEFLSLHCEADEAMRILELTCQMGWIEQQPNSLLFLPKHRGLMARGEDTSR